MNIGWIKTVLRAGERIAVKYAPEILMGLGTASVTGAAIYAAKAGPKTVYLIEKAEIAKAKAMQDEADRQAREQGFESSGIQVWREPLTLTEKIQACWKVSIAPAGLLIVGLGCFWGAHGISAHRQAILAGLASTAEAKLHDYQAKVAEMIGEKGEKEVRKSIAQDIADRNPPPENPDQVILGGANSWCIIDNRHFRSSYLKIKDSENVFNHKLLNNLYGSKAELYWLLDPEGDYLRPSPDDYEVGWSIDRLLELDVEPAFGPNHEQILVIEYRDKNGFPYPAEPGFSASVM